MERTVSRVFFADEVTGGSEPVSVASEFPSGPDKVYAFVTYAGMTNGLSCQSVWYLNGQAAASTPFEWVLDQSGETWVDLIRQDGGLPSGQYDWELIVEREVVASGSFTVGTPAATTPRPQSTRAPVQVQGPRIVFSSLRDRNNELYAMNAEGSGVTRLTNNPAIDYDPACSPDGSRVAFMSRRDGNNEIYVMNSDGTGVKRLTNNAGEDWDPAWSPDGGRLAFVSDRAGNADIHVMNADGGGVIRVTSDAASDRWPSWSPDRTRIAFTSYLSGNDELVVRDVVAGRTTRLTSDSANDWDPAWSPEGTRIAFTSYLSGNDELMVRDVVAGRSTRLTNNAVNDGDL